MTLLPGRARAAALGWFVDQCVGEPPERWHPLRGFGRLMDATERLVYADRRSAGLLYASVGTSSGAIVGAVSRSTLLATYVSVGGRALGQAAQEAERLLIAHRLDEARRATGEIVGRDTAQLNEVELARAVVETVAENSVDAIVAPLCWAVAAGAPGALAYRAVNTLDAMVGYRCERYANFGWASAVLDDVVNYFPARLAVGLVMLVRPRRALAVWRVVRRDAPHHPSPNAGVIEAAFAGALNIRLGGLNEYDGRVEERPSLGEGPQVCVEDIARARRLTRDVAWAMVALLVGGSFFRSSLEGVRRA